jgi:hypothetical protein
VVFAGFYDNAGTGAEAVGSAINGDGALARFDKEDFGHVWVDMTRGNLAGGEPGLGKVGHRLQGPGALTPVTEQVVA